MPFAAEDPAMVCGVPLSPKIRQDQASCSDGPLWRGSRLVLLDSRLPSGRSEGLLPPTKGALPLYRWTVSASCAIPRAENPHSR